MITRKISAAFLAVAMATTTAGMMAQDRDHDRDHGYNGHDNGRHEGWNNGRGNPHNDYHFRDDDRARMARYYRSDLNRYNRYPDRRHQWDFRAGQRIPAGVTFRSVPSSYYRGLAPLPPGYRYGYSDGYVVAYDPTSRMIADVMDLVGTAVMSH